MRSAALIVALLALLAVPVAAGASPRQKMSFEAPTELLDYAQVETVLDEIEAFGVHRVRQPVYWQDYAPGPDRKTRPTFDAADPEAYPRGAWDRLDTLIGSAQERDIDVTLTPTGPVPRWATASKRGHLNRPGPRQFGRFVTALARRYGEDVDMWSVWNEPNQPQFLRPQYRDGRPYSPRLYRALYRNAYRAIRSVRANRDDTILLGETAPRGSADIVHPLEFLRGVACLDDDYDRVGDCIPLKADGYAHHAYTTRLGPRYEPPDEDDVTIGVLSRLITALNRAGRTGALPARLKVYLTEFGIQSHPDRRSGVPLARQPADYAIAEHIAYVNRRVALFSQYLMRDDAPRETGYRFRGFESGLRRYSGVRKPAYAAFANPLAVERYGSTDVLWGRIRPQPRETRVRIERRRPGKGGWKLLRTLTTSSRGVYGLRAKHRKDQQYRVRWRARSGRRHTGPPIRAY
jgi:hypothetical protein